jgi:hypothetical protein
MKIEFYPNLAKAVESLKRGEGLYTDSRFLLDPVRIVYKRERKSVYKASGLDHTGYTWDKNGGDKILVFSEIEKGGRKQVHARLLKGEETIKLGDTKNLYKCLILKTEELEELIEGLTSLLKNNRKVFKKAIEDIVYLGLRRIKIKNKDFAIIEDLSWQVKSLGIYDFFRKQITRHKKNEKWKEIIGSYFLYFGERAIKGLRETLSNLTKKVEKVEENIRWNDVLVVVDRVPNSETVKVLTETWEDDRILGIETDGAQRLIRELQDHFKNHGKESLEKSFPNVLASISIHTSNLPKPEEAEFSLIPLGIEEKDGELMVDYLPLVKLKVEDKKFIWSPIKPSYLADVNIRVLGENSIRILSMEKVPKILSERKGKSKSVMVKANLMEEVEISYSPEQWYTMKRGERISVKEVEYTALLKGFTRTISIEESSGLVENIKENEEGRTKSEKISVRVLLKSDLNPRIEGGREREGDECLGRGLDKLIGEEMRKIASEIRSYEESENNKEKKGALKTARLTAERISEVFNEGRILKSKCYTIGGNKSSYRYEAYPTKYSEEQETVSAEGHKPIAEEEELLDTLKEYLPPKILKRAEKTASFLKSEKGAKVCFNDGKEKVIVSIDELEEMSKMSKEKLILREISRNLVREFLKYNYSGEIKEESGKPLVNKELKEIDEMALELSGSIVSSIIYPWKNFVPIDSKIREIMENIYTEVFKSMTGSSYTNARGGQEMYWVKDGEPMINGKSLLQAAIGVLIEIDVAERIVIRMLGEGQKPAIGWSMYIKKNPVTKPVFFLEIGTKGVVAEVGRK